MTELQLIDREKSGGRTEWIVGRSPYFISHKPDGDELWISHRPYAANEMVYKFDPSWAITLESIDSVIAEEDYFPFPRSGAEARTQGRVPEYAASIKQKLIGAGESEDAAEITRLEIIDRFKEEI